MTFCVIVHHSHRDYSGLCEFCSIRSNYKNYNQDQFVVKRIWGVCLYRIACLLTKYPKSWMAYSVVAVFLKKWRSLRKTTFFFYEASVNEPVACTTISGCVALCNFLLLTILSVVALFILPSSGRNCRCLIVCGCGIWLYRLMCMPPVISLSLLNRCRSKLCALFRSLSDPDVAAASAVTVQPAHGNRFHT